MNVREDAQTQMHWPVQTMKHAMNALHVFIQTFTHTRTIRSQKAVITHVG